MSSRLRYSATQRRIGRERLGKVGKEVKKAVAYLRTSSKTNVGPDKDSDKRQLAAIEAYAKAAGYEVVGTYYDAAVSGADPVGQRSGFAEMLRPCWPTGRGRSSSRALTGSRGT